MGPLDSLEKYLVDVSKKLPQLPKNIKKVLADIAPWASLVGAVFSIWAIWTLWSWAHAVSGLAKWANELNAIYGTGQRVAVERMTVTVWIGLAILLVEAILLLVAFPALRKYAKSGWNLLFLMSIVNLVYGVVMMFSLYGGIGNLFGTIIGAVIGWYVLFQIREIYLGKPKKEEPQAKEEN